ncbi:MAG: OmpA family protein [Wenzhouxiangella sp.]|nr:MAG: OmpA family protein [Wenzhouxiangella sp.]
MRGELKATDFLMRFMSKTWMTTLSCAAVFAIQPAVAEVEGSGDHRLIPRLDGSEIITYRFVEFDRVTLPFGPRNGNGFEDERTLEGEHTRLTYVLRNPEVTTLQVKRAYRQGLEDAGFEIAYAGSGRSELGRRFHAEDAFDRDRRGASRRTLGWTRGTDDRDKRFLAAEHAEEDVYVTALIYNNRDLEPVIRMDVVEVPEQEPTLAMAAPEPAERQPVERDDIVAAHEREDLSAEAIEESIVAEGRVAVRDILFEFDSAEIIDESADALATISEVMAANEELDLLIVGHTDNVGDFDYNLNLSMQRAQAVAAWLEERHDVDGDRLQAAGAGMMAPTATNRNEDGRARNRRVELVEL